jgi:hypothetical protein
VSVWGEFALGHKIYGESVPAQLKKQANKNVRITFAVYEYLGGEKARSGRRDGHTLGGCQGGLLDDDDASLLIVSKLNREN